jgi:hypothetical protein
MVTALRAASAARSRQFRRCIRVANHVPRQAHVLDGCIVDGQLDRLDIGHRKRGQHAFGEHQEVGAFQELLQSYLPGSGVRRLIGIAERHLAAIHEVHRKRAGRLHRFSSDRAGIALRRILARARSLPGTAAHCDLDRCKVGK